MSCILFSGEVGVHALGSIVRAICDGPESSVQPSAFESFPANRREPISKRNPMIASNDSLSNVSASNKSDANIQAATHGIFDCNRVGVDAADEPA